MGDFACHGLFSVRLADFHPGAGNWAWRGGLCHDQRHQLLFYRFRLRFPKISFIVSYWLGMADCPCGKASAQSGRGSLRMSAYPGGRDHVSLFAASLEKQATNRCTASVWAVICLTRIQRALVLCDSML